MFFCWNHVFFKFEVSVISSDHAFAQIVPLLAAFTVAASEFGSQTFNKHFSPTTPWVFPWLSCSFIFNLQEFWNGFKKRFHISECICFLFVRICTLSLYLLSMFQLRSYKIIDFIGCKCPRCNGPERLRLNQVENSNLGGAGAVHFLSPDLHLRHGALRQDQTWVMPRVWYLMRPFRMPLFKWGRFFNASHYHM